MRYVLSLAALVVIACAALVGSFAFGPLSRASPFVLIDARYLTSVQLQYLFSGLLASLATGSVAVALGVGNVATATILIVCGVILYLGLQSSEPDFMERIVPEIVEFLVPYATACALTLGAVAGVRALLARSAE